MSVYSRLFVLYTYSNCHDVVAILSPFNFRLPCIVSLYIIVRSRLFLEIT